MKSWHACLLEAGVNLHPRESMRLRRPYLWQYQSEARSRRHSKAAAALLRGSDDQQNSTLRSAELKRKHRPSLKQPRLTEDDKKYWEHVAKTLQSPHASINKFLQEMDLSYPFGVTPDMISSKAKPKLYEDFIEYKLKDPRKVILVRIGEFYETLGLDAVLLITYCNLNQMGKSRVTLAGFPKGNIDDTVSVQLVEGAGLSAAVYEEIPPAPGGKSKKRLGRYMAQVLTPARPIYMHGMVDRSDRPQAREASHPILGVTAGVSGFKVIEVNIDLFKYTIQEGLTDDSVMARLHQGGLAPPLYIHRTEQGGSRQGILEHEWALRVKQLFRSQAGAVEYYQGDDPVRGLLDTIKREQSLPADAKFIVQAPDPRMRAKPLFNCTASQLGMNQTPGIPSLLDGTLPHGSPTLQRSYLRHLLHSPPPSEVAASIREACSILAALDIPLPNWVVLDMGVVARLLNARETPVNFFRDLHAVVCGVQNALEHPELQLLADSILVAVVLEAGMHFDPDTLLQACRNVRQAIEDVVKAEEEEETAGAEDDPKQGVQVLQDFFASNETFRGKVKADLMRPHLSAVEEAGERVVAALREAYEPIADAGDLPYNAPKVHHDTLNNAVCIKVVSSSKGAKRMEQLSKSGTIAYIVPIDRNGKTARMHGMRSTDKLQDALAVYRVACEEAHQAVREQLRKLAARLQGSMNDLVGATLFSVIASSLEAHVREALRKGWAQPVQLHHEDGRKPMHMEGMWPYWLDGRKESIMRNDLDLSSMVILTGPNMAGKSTVMRSVCAVAVLAACGLYAPVVSATVPYTDAFMLRSFSGDSPLEGRSAFAVEMSEVRHVAADVSEHSLVLVDELGKGTEPHAGTCIAASFVEFLSARGCRGMFATHLHQLLDMEGQLDLSNVEYMCMESVDAADCPPNSAGGKIQKIAELMGERVPTWRIVPGKCRHSLAFVVMAEQCGPDHDLVRRAVQLRQMQEEGGFAGAAGSAATSSTPAADGGAEGTNSPAVIEASSELSTHSNSPTAAHHKGIEEARSVLGQMARHVFRNLAGSRGAAKTDGLKGDAGASGQSPGVLFSHDAVPEVQLVRKGQNPPPSVTGSSCVYVIRRPDGKFYTGETDNLKARLTTHRKRSGSVQGGPSLEAAYVKVPSSLQGKSAARALEARVIESLDAQGFFLLSKHDAQRKTSPQPV